MSNGTTSRVLMVEPLHFYGTSVTPSDNTFQRAAEKESQGAIAKQALQEFERCVALLRERGVNVTVFSPPEGCTSTDVVFCRHWFSTHLQLGGICVLYPMRSPERRTERSPEIIQFLKRRYPITVDLTSYEGRKEFLEGGGSLVLDRRQRIAFMATSTRSSERLAERWAALLGYRLLLFNAADGDGTPIIHTELLLSISEDLFVWCPEVVSEESLPVVREAIEDSRRATVELTAEQMMAFSGSLAYLNGASGKIILLSTRAHEALTEEQLQVFSRFGEILHTPLDTIETYGGASAGSLIAELV
ncbi:arginine deiminase-related protein [bacterium]|nr:arginine deiminase-related protein [bacterium]